METLEWEVLDKEWECIELKRKEKYSANLESAKIDMLQDWFELLWGLIENEAVSHKKQGEWKLDNNISQIIEGELSLKKSHSSHALWLDNVKKKVLSNRKWEGQGSYLQGGVVK